MIYELSDAADRDKLLTAVLRDIEKAGGTVEYTHRRQRSLNQNSYLHVLCAFFACQYGCSEDYAKRIFYKQTCNADIYRMTRRNNRGEFYDDWRSSASLSSEEMSVSIDRFKIWAAEIGITLPDADDHKFIVHCQKEIERNKQFL